MTTPRTAGERLADLETLVKQQDETIAQLQAYTLALHKSMNAAILLFSALPDLLNQSMPAVRAAEVRKFKNHLDLAKVQHVERMEQLTQEES